MFKMLMFQLFVTFTTSNDESWMNASMQISTQKAQFTSGSSAVLAMN